MAVIHAALLDLFQRRKTAEPMPLLRSPFSGAGKIAISHFKPGWTGQGHSQTRLQQIREMVVDGGIGGSFWQAAPELPDKPKHVVVLPPGLIQASYLWASMLGSHRADSLLALHPPSHELRSLLTQIAATGASVAPSGNPHPVLDIAITVHAGDDCDLATIAAIAGIPSFQLREGKFEKRSPGYCSALIGEGTLYTDPYTGNRAELEQIAEILGDWRRMFTRNRAIAACTGISLWKRRRIAQLLYTGEAPPRFHRTANAAVKNAGLHAGAVAAWTSRFPKTLQAQATTQNIPIVRLEDGFIRSAGLGSALFPPASIVADRQGIYFDPARPGDLETLLSETQFSEALIHRANRLIDLLRLKDVSKYGTGGPSTRLHARPSQRVILVPGQVADDLSLQHGTRPPICSNLALLREVRRRNPDAFIVYRPHPDVAAGHRRGAIPEAVTRELADQSVANGSIAALIVEIDEVHTMTSLAGFEALLRGKIVQTFGQPFYAGWGLTIDHLPPPRRGRHLRLEELAAAALILYPNYVDPATGLLCGPEMLIARLQQPELWRPGLLMHLRRLQGVFRRHFAGWTGPWIRSDA